MIRIISLNRYLFSAIFLFGGFLTFAQTKSVTVSGLVKDKSSHAALSFINVVLKAEKDSAFVMGTISNEEGRFILSNIKPAAYIIEFSQMGYSIQRQKIFVGSLIEYLDLATIELAEDFRTLNEVIVTSAQDEVSNKLDKKTFSVAANISQSGGSVMQAMQNLPGVTVQDGKVQLRGNDKVVVLIDGKQTALTGFGSQSGLDNIPASAIDRIEIINNPSAKYDANGNAGIINIIYKKSKKEGLNGKVGFATGTGALWVKKDNLPTLTPQYQVTPKFNPSAALNYKKKNVNVFFQADNLYTHTLNKNEFVTRTYDDGTVITQQTKRNRNTNFLTGKAGIDWAINNNNSVSASALFGSEKILDHGEEPFFNRDSSDRQRLWKFLEDELKTTVMATVTFQHKFEQPGRLLTIGYNYTFHRENEQYFFDNILPAYTGRDAFKLLSDEQVSDFTLDYIKPLRYGRLESGAKLRKRDIPTNMQFFPGINSPLDTNAGGWAAYKEIIPAVYGNYIYENPKIEAEIGLRLEYVKLNYEVNPEHNTYKSNGYNYTQPFPTLRFAYKLNDHNKISAFYNRRVDRPNEVDIRIFPKYDDAEIIKVGNPALRPQFTQSFEMGYKSSWKKGYLYFAAYHKITDGTITRISSTVPGSTLIYAIFQNVNKSYNSGMEMVVSQEFTKWYSVTLNAIAYHNQINAFTIENKYPSFNTFTAGRQEIISGNIKWLNVFHFTKNVDVQLSAVYLAPDIIPQGKMGQRFSLDLGVKKQVQNGKGEIYANATDLLNTMVIRKDIRGDGFNYTSSDYYETQVVRIGYNYKF